MYLVFDIGGTKIRLAVSEDKETLSEVQIFPTPKDYQEGLNLIKNISLELSRGQIIQVAAGGISGPIDKEKTHLIQSSHLPNWADKSLKQDLEKALNASVYLENDTALVGLGESNKGAGKGNNIVAYITVSTGAGGTRIVNQKIDQNAMGFEMGHHIIEVGGKDCNCGGKGHWESYIGGSYIEKIYGKKGEDITDPQIWDEIARYLAIGLSNTIVYWSPSVIVLGGSVAKSIPIDRVEHHLKEILTIFPTHPPILKAQLGDEAGLYGALEYLKQHKD